MTRPALRSDGAPQVKELMNQRHILSRNVSDLLRTAPLWLWSECLDHPSQLDFGWRAPGDIRKRMLGDIQHMWCCLDMAKHIRLASSCFFSLSRLWTGVPSTMAWHALRRPCGYVVGTVRRDDPARPALRWRTPSEGIDESATHFVKKFMCLICLELPPFGCGRNA